MKDRKGIFRIINISIIILILGTFLFPWVQIGEKEFTVLDMLKDVSAAGGLESYIKVNNIFDISSMGGEISIYLFVIEKLMKMLLGIAVLEIINLVLTILKKKSLFIKNLLLVTSSGIVCVILAVADMFGNKLTGPIMLFLVCIDLMISKYFEWVADEEEKKNKKSNQSKLESNFQKLFSKYKKRKRFQTSRELNKVYKKGVFKNFKNLAVFVLSSSLIVAVIFQVYYMKALFSGIGNSEIIDMTVGKVIVGSMNIITILLIFFLVLSMMNYFRSRSREYGLLSMLGIEDNTLDLLQLKEYIMVLVLSLVMGFILGEVIARVTTSILNIYMSELIALNIMQWTIYFNVARDTLAIWIAVYIIFNQLVFCLGADAVLMKNVQKTKWPKHQNKFFIAGLAILLLVISIMGTPTGQKSLSVPIVLSVLSIYFIYFSINAIGIENLKKKSSKYYKKIFYVSKYSHRFSSHINMQFCTVVFIFILVFVYSARLLDQITISSEDEKYPYDLVWMANKEDDDFLEKVSKSYSIDYKTVPFIRITTGEYAQNLGMSESEYNRWSGEDLDVKSKEINIVYQCEEKERNQLGISWDHKKPYMHIGKGEKTYWIKFGSDLSTLMTENFTKEYSVEKTYTNNIIGSFRDYRNENIIIFSDEDYEKIKNKADGANYLVTMNIPNESKEVAKKEIKEYAKEHSERNFVDGTLSLYDKDELVIKDNVERLLSSVIYIVISLIILISSLFMIILKCVSELTDIRNRSKLFKVIGVSPLDEKTNIKREYLREIWAPSITGIAIGSILLIEELCLRNMSGALLSKYLINYSLLLFILLMVLSVVSFVGINILYKYIKDTDR